MDELLAYLLFGTCLAIVAVTGATAWFTVLHLG